MPNERLHDYVAMSYHRVTLRICLLLMSLTINDVIGREIANQRHGGVHVENGHDQTIIDKVTTDEKLALEHDLFKRRRLPDKSKSANGKAPLIMHSASKFLLDVYKNKVDEGSETTPNEIVEPSEFDFTGNDLRRIHQSDVIMTFRAQHSHQEAGMWFDVEAAAAEDQMTSAELRIYRSPNAKNRMNRGAFTVTAYRILNTKDGETEMQFVDSANTTAGHEGWITLNVTESLLHWMNHSDDNKGLRLSVRPIDRSSHEIRPEEIGIVGIEGDAEHQPFMACFFRSNKFSNVGLLPSMLGISKKRNKKRHTTDRMSGGLCNVKKFYVNFKDLDWQKRIVAPEGINANYCSGDCTDVNVAAYHAAIQHYVNKLYPKKMPKVGCVPTGLSGIDGLYYISEKTVALRKWDDMTVEACGCV